ncbi:MAG: PepSY-associated TM helix domain-containing protein [Bryobacteraceae bacterium]
MRKNIYNIHLYSALVTGLILIVIAVTGCLLVLELRMDHWLDPKVSYVEPKGNPVPFTKIMEHVNAAYPGQKVTEINIGEPGISVMARLSGRRVFVDPYTGKITGSRTGEPPSFHLRHVHRELSAGKVGATIVNITTFLLLLQSLSGLYLWWPLKRTTVKLNASSRKITLDLHHAAGFFSSAFICILAVTGLLKGYGDFLQPYFDTATGSPRMTRDLISKPRASAIGIDDAVATAQIQLPGARLARIIPPKTRNGSWVIELKFPGDSTVPGRSWVVVDQYSGAVLSRLDSRTAPTGSKIPIVNREIHVGGLYGTPTRILAFLAGLAVLIQTVTGYMMWWRKRAAARHRSTVRRSTRLLLPDLL